LANVKKIFSSEQIYNNTRGSAHWACIAHLRIEWYWSKFQREIIITLKNHPSVMKKFSCKINGPSWGGQFTSIWNLSQSETRIVKVMFLSHQE
jgi:hypothetical protein